MPLTLIPPSELVEGTYRSSLGDLRPEVARTIQYRHLPAWTLRLADAAAGGPLDKARPGGCRFYALDGRGEAFSCEMTDPGDYGRAAFRNLVEGEIPAKFVALMDHPPPVDDFNTRNFEIHLLSISSLFLEALWLRDPEGGEGYILPVICLYDELLAQPALKESKFLDLIAPLARQRLTAAAAAARSCKIKS